MFWVLRTSFFFFFPAKRKRNLSLWKIRNFIICIGFPGVQLPHQTKSNWNKLKQKAIKPFCNYIELKSSGMHRLFTQCIRKCVTHLPYLQICTCWNGCSWYVFSVHRVHEENGKYNNIALHSSQYVNLYFSLGFWGQWKKKKTLGICKLTWIFRS